MLFFFFFCFAQSQLINFLELEVNRFTVSFILKPRNKELFLLESRNCTAYCYIKENRFELILAENEVHEIYRSERVTFNETIVHFIYEPGQYTINGVKMDFVFNQGYISKCVNFTILNFLVRTANFSVMNSFPLSNIKPNKTFNLEETEICSKKYELLSLLILIPLMVLLGYTNKDFFKKREQYTQTNV